MEYLEEEGRACKEYAVVLLVVEEVHGLLDVVVAEVGAAADDSDGGEGGFLAEVGTLTLEKTLDVGTEIAGYAGGTDVTESAEGKAGNVLVGVIYVTIKIK